MFQKSLSWWLNKAQNSDWAIPHFNISTADQLQSIVEVCYEMQSPVIIGLSEGEADFIGYDIARILTTYWHEQSKLPIFLNADHHHSLERAKLAIDNGFDGVNIDCSLKTENENIAETKAVVDYARRAEHSPLGGARRRKVNVEGEIGALPTQSSEILKKKVKIDPATLTTPEQAKLFVDITGINRLTPAVGTLHGIEPNGRNPHIDIERLKEIAQAVRIPLTLHGGSGTPTSDIKKALPYLSNIHINTDLRVAYTQGLKKEISKTTTPYKYLKPANDELQKVVKEKTKLFDSDGKI